MLKKSAALITCVMLVLTLLAGCSGDTNSASGTAAGSENIEINIVSSTMRLESMVDGWEQMIANFEAENPGVTVNLDMQDWEELPQYIAQARMAGEQIDIIRTTGGQIRSTLAPAGALMDITDVVEPIADRFTEGTLDAYNIGGRQWGIPYSATEVSCVYYNKTMFDELGLEEPQKKKRPWGLIVFAAGLILLWGMGLLLLPGNGGRTITLCWTLLNLSLLWGIGWLLALAARALWKYVSR